MKTYSSIQALKHIKKGCVLTIGNFDGVHAGHCEILSTAARLAKQRSASVAVMTFEPHPVAVLYPERAPGVLTPLPLKLTLLEPYVHDCLIVLEDSKDLLKLSAEAFVDQFLMQDLCPSVIVEGDDFHFGAGRRGTIETLQTLGQARGFEVEVVSPKTITLSTGQSLRVSSTMIRYMLESGHVEDASMALQRPYRLFGKIISGRGKGRELGYPTLNMETPEQIIPAEGVYAGHVRLSDTADLSEGLGDPLPAVFSLGQARTFGDQFPLLIEAHLLSGQAAPITSAYMALDFVTHLRSQHKFPSVEALVTQISADCQRARKALGMTRPE
ncbi:MAG: bifunctional riboflavin kinase/FAD synthetase [Phycisphaerae bacterium]|nr:bifunctional riboflavin kinase/FAD synthetase [Phycisphaerae bacterium]